MRLSGRVVSVPPPERGFQRLKEALGQVGYEVRPPAHRKEISVFSVRPHRVKVTSYKQEWNRGYYRLRRSISVGGFLFYSVCKRGVYMLFERIREDIQAVKDRDPAARNSLEIFFLYPGVKAIRMYRRANFFFRHKMFFLARLISQRAVRKTGIEIHPGATIGRRLVIDHGTGVVIGETTEIGDDVLIYQGVTLGGTGKDMGKRHPTIGNNVMISSGAKVLGPFKVGDNARIASGAVVLEEVPAGATVVGVPARVVRLNGEKVKPLDQIHIPDPVMQEICRLEGEIFRLNKEIEKLKEGK